VGGAEPQAQAIAAVGALQAASDEAEREAAAAAVAEAEAEAKAEREAAEAALRAAREKQKPKEGYTAINRNVRRELERTWQDAKVRKKHAKRQAEFIKLFGGFNMIRREEQEAQVDEDVSVGGHSSHSGEDRDGIKMAEEFVQESKQSGELSYGVSEQKKVISYGARARKDAKNAAEAEKMRLRSERVKAEKEKDRKRRASLDTANHQKTPQGDAGFELIGATRKDVGLRTKLHASPEGGRTKNRSSQHAEFREHSLDEKHLAVAKEFLANDGNYALESLGMRHLRQLREISKKREKDAVRDKSGIERDALKTDFTVEPPSPEALRPTANLHGANYNKIKRPDTAGFGEDGEDTSGGDGETDNEESDTNGEGSPARHSSIRPATAPAAMQRPAGEFIFWPPIERPEGSKAKSRLTRHAEIMEERLIEQERRARDNANAKVPRYIDLSALDEMPEGMRPSGPKEYK